MTDNQITKQPELTVTSFATRHPVEKFLKRVMWLAYNASTAVGMGMFKATDEATEDDVWENVTTHGDYPQIPRNTTTPQENPSKGTVDADYVFGRMMKLNLRWEDNVIHFNPSDPRPDYQSWANTYTTYRLLLEEAEISLNCELEPLPCKGGVLLLANESIQKMVHASVKPDYMHLMALVRGAAQAHVGLNIVLAAGTGFTNEILLKLQQWLAENLTDVDVEKVEFTDNINEVEPDNTVEVGATESTESESV